MATPDATQYDVSTYFSGAPPSVVDEELRLRLAGKILLGIALIAGGVFVAYALCPQNEALVQIFELVKIGVLPLATLVVSFYFTKD